MKPKRKRWYRCPGCEQMLERIGRTKVKSFCATAGRDVWLIWEKKLGQKR